MEGNTKKKITIKRVIRHINEYWLNDVSFVVLMVVLVFTAFILPILIEYGHVSKTAINLVFLGIFFTGIWSSDNKLLVLLTAFLFLAQIVFRMFRFSDIPVEFYFWELIFGLINMGIFIFLNIRLLFRDHEVNLFRVIGAVNVYLLLAILGAFGFETIDLTVGDSISGLNPSVDSQDFKGYDQDFPSYIYYSFVCLTTVGFGDFVPVNIMSKMLSVFLSTTGILYPAVVIAKLVGYSAPKK